MERSLIRLDIDAVVAHDLIWTFIDCLMFYIPDGLEEVVLKCDPVEAFDLVEDLRMNINAFGFTVLNKKEGLIVIALLKYVLENNIYSHSVSDALMENLKTQLSDLILE
ncbi:hypothetical protein [Deinococcus roseus]|uniref:Uncharacterized protein n=1 Tax=Deinococcus roseus TaxID=392414 RepID=A0ABQ2CXP4_9DEIO|nr:hypothetical protein [Deinococcus roseus]GGJ31019.1 hypothetical protein GCM10008938_16380 [Deinococcus roseus]